MAEVLLGEEVTRAHGFSGVLTLVSLGVAAALPWLGGDPSAKLACGAVLLVVGLASIALFRHTREPHASQGYSRRAYRMYGWLLVLGVIVVEHYIGYFSPVPVILTLGIYYLGQSSDRSHSFILPLVVIASYATLATLATFSVIEDRGLFSAHAATRSSQVFAVIGVSAVLVFALRMARVSRRAVREAIERSNETLLIAQRREAQLAEAHHQLDRALRVSVGKQGRHSGAMAGDYCLGIVIGVGAVGEVYEAKSTRDGSRAAVKLLQATAAIRDDLVERILREGAICSKLDNPHTVRVLDVGRLSEGAPYVAMELLDGRDLATRLRQEGQLSLSDLKLLAEHLGAGLEHAHQLGIIHRDLKPLNIFEIKDNDEPCWKILDFGISKLGSSTGTLTQEGIVGTPGYMSPEQARGAVVDHRSDIFSMAVVLYRAMTGQPAFSGDSTPQIMFDIVYGMPRRPGAVTRGLPSDVDRVMAIGLAKEPDQRFQSADELARAFAQACRRKLAPALRDRADALTRAQPWGATMAPRTSPSEERHAS
jgi:hypothetical protein